MSITGLKNRDDTQTLNMSEEKKKIDSVLENKNLDTLVKDTDLSKFIL